MTSDGTNCYTYNDANQLSKVTNCNTGQTIAQYVYDYQGNRIEKKVYNNNSLQQTIYTPNKDYQTVKVASNGATLNTSYYYVNDELAAQKNPDGSKYYFLSDNLGSTSTLTDQNGNVVENTTYLPFGQIQSGGTDSKYLYTGQQNDQETNLDYYNARYYDPSIEHFTQPDSELPNVYDPQQLNRYAYVRNNPMTVTDPTGHAGVFDYVAAIVVMTAGIVDLGLEVGGAIHGAVTSHDTSFQGRALSAAAGAQEAVQSPVGQFAYGSAFFAYTLATGRTVNNDEDDSVFTTSKETTSETTATYHGNDLRNTNTTYGYQLVNILTGNIAKFGQSITPDTRYSQQWLNDNNLRMDIVNSGTKLDMRAWEHEQIGNYIFENGEAPSYNDISHSVNVFR